MACPPTLAVNLKVGMPEFRVIARQRECSFN
jgi:hypothetical protein